MNAALTLEQIIQQELEAIIVEQRGAVIRQAPTAKFNAKRVAKQIYDAKGTFSDDEHSAINAIRQIKNIDQYKQVFSSLKRLTDGRGIAAYLKSFLSAEDRVQVAIHLYDVLPASQYSWTVKKLVTYDMLKTALSTVTGKGSRYNKLQYGDLPGRSINQIRKMFDDPAMYKNVAQQDAETERDGFDASDILFRPFVSTEYYLKYKSLSAWINAPGGLRDTVYSPAGIGVTTAASLIPSPWTRVPNALLFAILTIDDISRIAQGDNEAWLEIIWDSLGIIGGSGLAKIGKTIGSKFASLLAWIESGGVLVKISQKMFAKLFEIVEAFSKTKLGNYLSGGAKVIDALQSTIRSRISKSLSMIKNILTRLKNSTPDPVKRWADNALESLKSTSVEYYMSELKPIFDTMRLLAKVLREFIRAPKTAILDLARRLGIQSEWVIPVATGAQAAWVAQIFYSIPTTLSWWVEWYSKQLTKQESEKVAQELKGILGNETYYTFKNKPQTTIKMYFPTNDNVWLSADYTIPTYKLKSVPGKKLPIYFILKEKKSGYAKITIPIDMRTPGEVSDAWVKISDIELAPKLK
jgi:hypothetical protein